MKVYVSTPYQKEYEEPTEFRSGSFQHHAFAESITIQKNGQMFSLVWDEQRNALRIISDNKLNIEPSSANGILIQDTKN